MNAFDAVEGFEQALCEYTGAPYAVTTTRCTIAIWACLEYLGVRGLAISIPRRTYRGIPQTIVRAGGLVSFDDRDWSGGYSLNPLPVSDYARRFAPGMYTGGFQCLSFHTSKILGHTQGGAVLCEDPKAADWFKRAFRDGQSRSGVDYPMIGIPAYLDPGTAAELHRRLHWLKIYWPGGHPDLPNSDYPDLSLTDWNSYGQLGHHS